MIISIHMPKTGGSSFRYLLEQYFSERVLFDYADRPMNTPEAQRLSEAANYNPKQDTALAAYDCVHGHFLATKYSELLGQAQFITWLRDPVERHLSRYYHYQRNQKKLGNQNILDAQSFCEKPDFQNIYAKFLQGISLEQFAFVGITEHYHQSLELFADRLGISLPAEQANRNINANKQKGASYDISDDFREYLATLNSQDTALYQQALEINGLA